MKGMEGLELIIVRHGETEWTLSGRHAGVTEISLTAAGEREAERIGPILLRLLGDRDPIVFTSPRYRAVGTAKLSMSDFDFPVEPLLSEYGYGRYEGLTLREIQTLAPGWDIWTDGCPDGETTADVAARADEFLARRAVPAERPVIAVTHGHFSRVLAARALRRPPEDGSIFGISTASVSVVKDLHERRSLYLWNMTAAAVTGGAGDRIESA
jgi:probable phosphoglycerate mutase